jgi:UDP-2,4-diacetamido-2,4,6-trideoxy-beta-L-altropyranose hydrolase
MRRLLVRADASLAIGAGHVMRCLAIAEAFRERGGRVSFLSSDLSPSLAERLRAPGIELVPLPASVAPASREDALATAELARTLAPVTLLVDGYSFARDYLRALAGPQVAVAYIDDHGLAELPVALVLNPNAGATPELYRRPQPARVLAGSQFTPLRAEYRRATVPERSFAPPLHLLITYGGSDPLGLTLPTFAAALEIAATTNALRAITVLAGPLCPDAEALAVAASSAPRGLATLLRGVSEMAALLASVDLAVGAAGSTSWELAHMGVPMAIGAVAENQRAVITPLVDVGAAWALGEGAELASCLAERLRAFITAGPSLHRAMSARGRALIDGRGAERVAAALESLELP